VRLAGVIRKDALVEEGQQVLKRLSYLRRRSIDQRLCRSARQRPLDRLVAKRCEMVGDEISHAAAEPPHRFSIELEW
jgi:hypothetical protein